MRFVVCVFAVLAATALPGAMAADKGNPDDEKAIRHNVDAFVAAFNAHDAKGVAGCFTADGSIVDEQNHVTKGREAIEKVFGETFTRHPESKLENVVESIQFFGANEAIEKGVTTTTFGKETPPEKGRYRVLHVKQDGKWLMSTAADMPEDAWTGEDELKKLEGFIGEWMDESQHAVVLTTYRWSENHRFIVGKFAVQANGKRGLEGTHRIGWDPLKKVIRSWVFDSEGGFAEGTWTQEGDTWVIKLEGVTRDGKPCSATEKMTIAPKHQMTIQSVNRVVGGKELPDGQRFLVVRRPPAPK